jgi:hypothetical protein
MEKIKDYRLIEAVTAKELEALVNQCIREGYVPNGAPSFNGAIYIQSMLKKEEE